MKKDDARIGARVSAKNDITTGSQILVPKGTKGIITAGVLSGGADPYCTVDFGEHGSHRVHYIDLKLQERAKNP